MSTSIDSPLCREATIADLDRLVALVGEFCAHFEYRFTEATTRKTLRELLDERALGRVFAIGEGAYVIGYVVLAFSFSLEFGGRTAFIDEFFIRTGGRGKGTGRRVLDELATTCRDMGIHAILLEAEADNARASALYEKAGYQFFGRRLMTCVLIPGAGYQVSPRSQ